MKSAVQFKPAVSLLLMTLATFCFAVPPPAQAVVPPPDGGYSNFTTAEGTNALKNLTTGSGNTAAGWYSLFTDSTASFNTGVGAGTLLFNNADSNTAIGTAALLFNTSGSINTAVGVAALSNNATAQGNSAIGTDALFSNMAGNNNTAIGAAALQFSTGGDNTAIGFSAGFTLTGGDNNIYIGSTVSGAASESNTIRIGSAAITDTYIRGISGATAAGGAAVFVTNTGKLGTMISSKRFKQDIKPMERASEALFALKPVTFRYKQELDPDRVPQFGLVAEEVEKVDPDLVARDRDGKPYTVRYEAVNAMLLNEFLKEHRKVQEQEATIAELKREMATVLARLKGQDSKIQKVTAQIESSNAAPQVLASNP
jgi:hypothetical protein